MLGKLIRYDSKVQIRFLCGVYIVAALLSGLSGIFLGLKRHFPNVMIFGAMSGLSWAICFLSVLAVFLGTMIYVVLYFRQNLLRDEGYLMHTLPVTNLQLYGSKLLTGTIFMYLSILVGYFCFGLGNLRFRYPVLDFLKECGVDGGVFWLAVLTFLIACPLMLCQFFFSLVLGYTWKMNSAASVNRDLLSVLSYIIIYMVQQAIALVGLFAYFFINFGSPFASDFIKYITELADNEATVQAGMVGYVNGLLWVSLVSSVLFGAILFILSVDRLNRHLNLE